MCNPFIAYEKNEEKKQKKELNVNFLKHFFFHTP